MFSRRKSRNYSQDSYTGVGTAPPAMGQVSLNALAAATAIGQAMKNNQPLSSLTQPVGRTNRNSSMTSNASNKQFLTRSSSLMLSRPPRMDSINSGSSRQGITHYDIDDSYDSAMLDDITEEPNNRNARLAPPAVIGSAARKTKSRVSFSDANASEASRDLLNANHKVTPPVRANSTRRVTSSPQLQKPVPNVAGPKMIKKYIPTPNGLVCVEVPEVAPSAYERSHLPRSASLTFNPRTQQNHRSMQTRNLVPNRNSSITSSQRSLMAFTHSPPALRNGSPTQQQQQLIRDREFEKEKHRLRMLREEEEQRLFEAEKQRRVAQLEEIQRETERAQQEYEKMVHQLHTTEEASSEQGLVAPRALENDDDASTLEEEKTLREETDAAGRAVALPEFLKKDVVSDVDEEPASLTFKPSINGTAETTAVLDSMEEIPPALDSKPAEAAVKEIDGTAKEIDGVASEEANTLPINVRDSITSSTYGTFDPSDYTESEDDERYRRVVAEIFDDTNPDDLTDPLDVEESQLLQNPVSLAVEPVKVLDFKGIGPVNGLSMASQFRPQIAQQQQETLQRTISPSLVIPARSELRSGESSPLRSNHGGQDGSPYRKPALKPALRNSQVFETPAQNAAKDAYISLTTAENTRMNANLSTGKPFANLNPNYSSSATNLSVHSGGRRAMRQSVQEPPLLRGPPPKAGMASRTMRPVSISAPLVQPSGSPGYKSESQKRASALYAKANSRPTARENDVQLERKSSFEKSVASSKEFRKSLRDPMGHQQQPQQLKQPQQDQHRQKRVSQVPGPAPPLHPQQQAPSKQFVVSQVGGNGPAGGGFKSRFADSDDEDDLPMTRNRSSTVDSAGVNGKYGSSFSDSVKQAAITNGSSTHGRRAPNRVSATAPTTPSKAGRFFSEGANAPRKEEEPKKKSGFGTKLKKLFGATKDA
ncbi:hypothetical protein BABINDRAFT_160548 [Babjeviella inositovora NRRL Y-12698]|uniref:Uncharacterized protein n=1 Tax=Babjeviella inositovora NRRL Y-12698 TaxID=984486 RepID=A0A1E3QU18_9ASCO|nr:uncharacterized protein BABINDRAFT_160548 [Babjeviella inositovora NRRL Y-12698]ODQ81149.1 hypothetical protein BABINDRAFT_160548 [Babjeviella inositovora NRRL Y-12698]